MSDDLQRTEQWHADRAGKFTGSRFVDVLARNKRTGEPLKAYHDLIWQVVVERMTGQAVEGPTGFALQWGTDVEPYAREAYELDTGHVVTESPFITHHKFKFAGCSPDGLIGADGGIEMKCPKDPKIHLERFLSGVPDEFLPQVQGCMWITGRKWWDFVSYDPRMPESHRLLRIRIDRDEEFIGRLELAVIEAESAVKDLLSKISNITTAQPSPPLQIVAKPAKSKEEAVIDNQDTISRFMASREFGKDANRIRAVLVEFVKFQAAEPVQKTA